MSNSFRSQTQRINVPVQTSQSGINVNIGGYSGTYTRARYDTTESWNSNPEFVPKRGEIIVYSDYDSYIDDQGETHYIPGIKVGDGNTLLTDLPFANAGQSSGGTGEIVPVFSVGAGGFSCDMTFEEVLNAINEKKCNGCRVNLVEYLLNANLLTLTNSQIVFCATTVGAMFNHDAEQEGVVFTLYILFNSDNTASIDLGNVDIANVLATPYSELSFPIAKGTVCYKGNRLYKANQDIATQEDWTNAHWDQTTVDNEMANKADTNDLPVIPVFTKNENAWTCDTTFADVYAAAESKKCYVCEAVINGSIIYANLVSMSSGYILFSATMPIDTSSMIMMIIYAANNEIQMQQIFSDANGNLAQLYGISFPVHAGDLRINIEERNHTITSSLYRAKLDISTPETFDSTKWEMCTVADETSRLSGAIESKSDYNAIAPHYEDLEFPIDFGTYILREDKILVCMTSIQTQKDFDPTDWSVYGNVTEFVTKVLHENYMHISNFADQYYKTTYSVGDYVTRNMMLYRCKTEITVPEEWTRSHWQMITISEELSRLSGAITKMGDLTELKTQTKTDLVAAINELYETLNM